MSELLPVENLIRLLYAPVFGSELPAEDIYLTACAGAVQMLLEQENDAALSEIVLRAPAEETRKRALAALVRGAQDGRETAVRALLTLGLRDAHPAIPDLLKRFHFESLSLDWNSGKCLLMGNFVQLKRIDPILIHLTSLFRSSDDVLRCRMLSLSEEKLPHWALLCGFFHDGNPKTREKILSAYGKFSAEEKKLFGELIQQMPKERANIAADLFFLYDEPSLKEICLSTNLFPDDSRKHGAFAFLTEQWTLYSEKDSGYRAVWTAFENGTPELKRRLIEIARRSGHSAWLSETDSSVFGERRGGNSLSEWQLLICGLRSSGSHEKLKELLPVAPLLCLPDILAALPEGMEMLTDESAFVEQVRGFVSHLPKFVPLPLAVRLNEPCSPICGISHLAGKTALSFVSREIRVWNGLDPNPETVITSGRMNFRRLSLSSNGRYLAVDCGDGTISVFSLPAGQLLKTISAAKQPLCGMVLTPKDKYLICVDSTGTVHSFSFPDGTRLGQFSSGLSAADRCAYDAEVGRLVVADAAGNIAVSDPERREVLLRLNAENGIIAMEEFVTEGCLTAVDGENRLFCRSLLSGMDRLSGVDCGLSARILRLCELQCGELCALSGGDGSGVLIQPSSGNCFASFSSIGERSVTGLCADLETEKLFAAHSDGRLDVFDLRLLNLLRSSFDLLHLPDMTVVDEFCRTYDTPEVLAWTELLRTVVAWRRRFDIEVDYEFEN